MVGIGSAMASLPVWGAKRDTSKNRGMGGALDLGGRCLMMAYNNQSRIGESDNGDVRAEARGQESAWGDTIPSFGASN